jgi:D-3-phosphoglycerate dehydrogenase / 2-oxoglutarate reductase
MSATLVLTEALPEPGMGVLAARADLVVRVLPAPTAAALRKALPTADGVVMVMEAPSLSADLIECASRLRVACRMGAGYDNFDVPALTRRRIPLATAGSANAATVAEHALYLMLALAKRGPALDRAVRTGAWPRAFGAIELRDLTCLIVGYGRIGRQVAQRAAAFAMRIVVVDPNVPAEVPAREGYARAETLESGLRQADFVVIACALAPATRGLIGAPAFAAMKPTAFVVNVARGPIIDEPALVAALHERRIAGAGLDVLETEPPRPDHPLLALDNVVLTPHTAAYVRTAFDRMAVATALNALAGLDGRLDREVVINPEVLGNN